MTLSSKPQLPPLKTVAACAALALLLAGCASDAARYPQLPGSAPVADRALSPAEQKKIIDELNAAKAKSEAQAK